MQADLSLLAFADDLTGALEVGGKFARAGATVVMRADSQVRHTGAALVIDTETRHLTHAAALARCRDIHTRARAQRPAMLYKKTDSTLRGNLAAEFAALSEAYPDRAIVFSPGYPEMGRTVRAGRVFVGGRLLHTTEFARDLLNPVLSSYVPDALVASGVPVALHTDAECELSPGVIHVFDADTDDNVAAVTQFLKRSTPAPIFCGTGSLAGHLSRALGGVALFAPPPYRPPVRRCIVINGSRHPRSAEQVQYAHAQGWPVAKPEDVIDEGASGNWTILTFAFEDSADPRSVAASTGRLVAEMVNRGRCDTLIIFGGDTAYAVIEAIGQTTLRALGEVMPGIPLSVAGPVTIISKAGGFGSVDILPRIRQQIGKDA